MRKASPLCCSCRHKPSSNLVFSLSSTRRQLPCLSPVQVLDKTGTLTLGRPQLDRVEAEAPGVDAAQVGRLFSLLFF